VCVSGVIDVHFGVTLKRAFGSWKYGCGEGGDEFCCLGYSVWRGGKSQRGRWWGYSVWGHPVWLVLITQAKPSLSDQQTVSKVAQSGFPKSSPCTDEVW